MLDRDMPFPTPKELARNINEVLPTEKHLEEIKGKALNKKIKVVLLHGGSKKTDFSEADKYAEELDKELQQITFPHLFNDLRNS